MGRWARGFCGTALECELSTRVGSSQMKQNAMTRRDSRWNFDGYSRISKGKRCGSEKEKAGNDSERDDDGNRAHISYLCGGVKDLRHGPVKLTSLEGSRLESFFHVRGVPSVSTK